MSSMYCMDASSWSITPLRRTDGLRIDNPEVDDGESVRRVRRRDHADEEVPEPAGEELGQRIEQVVESGLEQRGHAEDDQERPQDGPAVAAHELVRATKGVP